MSKVDATGLQDSGTIVRRIEFNKYGEPTGHEYYECASCGIDAMRPQDVEAHCECDDL